MNVPAVINLFRVLRKPAICLPHHTVSTFGELPIPLSRAFVRYQRGEKPVDIKAVVLDKDNCFAAPGSDQIHPSCSDKFQALIRTYSPENILIVSNSSGLLSVDPAGTNAVRLERNTGVKVLLHDKAKPACGQEILAHFNGRVSPEQIAIVGDRLFADVVMGNMMGSYTIWVRSGVVPNNGFVTKAEYGISNFLQRRGFAAPQP